MGRYPGEGIPLNVMKIGAKSDIPSYLITEEVKWEVLGFPPNNWPWYTPYPQPMGWRSGGWGTYVPNKVAEVQYTSVVTIPGIARNVFSAEGDFPLSETICCALWVSFFSCPQVGGWQRRGRRCGLWRRESKLLHFPYYFLHLLSFPSFLGSQ